MDKLNNGWTDCIFYELMDEIDDRSRAVEIINGFKEMIDDIRNAEENDLNRYKDSLDGYITAYWESEE
jgi:hypothetical protein